MEHVVAAGRRFGPACIGVQIGAEQGQTLADLAGAPLAQHGAHIAFALEVADRGAALHALPPGAGSSNGRRRIPCRP